MAEASKDQPLITINMVKIIFLFMSCGSRPQHSCVMAGNGTF